jgi:hypothetical protein
LNATTAVLPTYMSVSAARLTKSPCSFYKGADSISENS